MDPNFQSPIAPSNNSFTSQNSGGGNKFFVVILVLLILGVFGFAGYWYLTSYLLPKQDTSPVNTQVPVNNSSTQQSVNQQSVTQSNRELPTPTLSADPFEQRNVNYFQEFLKSGGVKSAKIQLNYSGTIEKITVSQNKNYTILVKVNNIIRTLQFSDDLKDITILEGGKEINTSQLREGDQINIDVTLDLYRYNNILSLIITK